MIKKLLQTYMFRPQGQPMVFPYTMAARWSQFPYRFIWHESWMMRYFTYSGLAVTVPLFLWIDSYLTSDANKKLWREKRKHDREHHMKEMELKWQVKT